MSNNDGYRSTQPESRGAYDEVAYIVRQIMAGAHHCEPVRVVERDGDTLSVEPLVNMLDGQGEAIPHGVINGVRYARMQAGRSAVILDPVANDIGILIIADRDMSSVVATRDAANPGSLRRNSFSDGVYLGGFLNAEPTQYIRFDDDGITVVSPMRVRMVSPSVLIDASAMVRIDSPDVSTTGNVRVGGGATGTFSTPQGTVVTVKDGIVTNIF